MEDLLDLYAAEAMSFDDFCCEFGTEVLNCNRQGIKNRAAQHHGRLDLNKLTDEDCKLKFRFSKDDLPRLADALGLPPVISTEQRYHVSKLEGLCILLRRLAYPNRLYDLEEMFGLSAPYLSAVTTAVLSVICTNKGHLLDNLNNLRWLHREKLEDYAQSVYNKGAPLESCWAFIDGTARQMTRPSRNQQEYYSGHKRYHCLKYQSVLTPDGLGVNLFGPCKGRRHDAGIFRESQLYEQLQQTTVFEDKKYVLYGDSGYPIKELLIRPYKSHNISVPQQNFNTAMSSIRQPVEWGFGKVVNEFAFVDFHKNQKLYLQDISKMYVTAVLLSNCHTCLYGCQTADYFDTTPPTLETYLQV